MRDEQEELFEFLFAAAQHLLFVALAALVLWPVGDAALALRFAKGGVVLWLALFLTFVALAFVQRKLDVDIYSHADAYVISAAAVGGFVQAGWSAFAALAVRDFASAAGAWPAAVLYFTGLLSCYVAFTVVSAFYTGQIYKLINLAAALVSFAAFCLWPAGARAAYGWFFRLFQSF
ncbi:MAG TPA: hypothetical protein VE642_10160 [Pyrinomonadaceae bacterium]|nr:hypothetical protein [Pyrinomonadaceae bacterium]